MPKVKMELELQGFKLKVEGERGDMPIVAHNLGQQFAHLLQPAANIAERATATRNSDDIIIDTASQATTRPATGRPRVRRSVTRSETENKDTATQALTWRHDPAKWGTPQSSWSVLEKCIYTLYVAGEETQIQEMTGSLIEKTFNKQFREAGLLRLSNILTSLKRAKSKKESPVGQDTRTDPSQWFLTDVGKKSAAELTKRSKGNP